MLVAGGVLGATVAPGCFFPGEDALRPPQLALYFPTGLAVSPGRTALYVANSDFDLQYNGGTVQAVQLADDGDAKGIRSLALAVADQIEQGATATDACAAAGATPNDNPVLYPGPCGSIAYEPFVKASTGTGAFTSGVALVTRPDAPGARLFATVRGDPSVTFFDIADDRDPGAIVSPCSTNYCLECASETETNRCGSLYRVGESTFTSQRGLVLPTEPVGISAGGDALVVAHQTSQAASLVIDRWPSAPGSTAITPFTGPTLEHLLSGLAEGPTGVAHIPSPGLLAARPDQILYREGFVITHRASATLTVARYEPDRASRPPRPFLIKAAEVPMSLSATGDDQRGLAIDSTEREACESLCDSTDADCLRTCLELPLRIYVASRAPESLLVGTVEAVVSGGGDAGDGDAVTSIDEVVTLDEVVPLPFGSSNVAIGKVVGLDGRLETRVFAVSFDQRYITVYDPAIREVEATIPTGRGPFGVAFDVDPGTGAGDATSLMYVGHFTDSYIGVVDLDTRRLSYGAMLLSLGPPSPPREEQ